ncbi:UBC6, partial [Symbiodinium sp. KB8]
AKRCLAVVPDQGSRSARGARQPSFSEALEPRAPRCPQAKPMGENLFEWHYVLEGPKGTDYEGGWYWGLLRFKASYPMSPPAVIMLTPSGRFKPGERLCLSISDFHPESW